MTTEQAKTDAASIRSITLGNQLWADEIHAIADRIEARIASETAETVAVPAGYALVPIEPTPAMQEAAAAFGGRCGYNKQRGDEAMVTWRDMIAAAPRPIPHTRGNAGLSEQEILTAVTKAVHNDELSWLGYEADADGRFTIPVLSQVHIGLVRLGFFLRGNAEGCALAADEALLRRALRWLEADQISKFGLVNLESMVSSGDHPVLADLRKRLVATPVQQADRTRREAR